MIPDKGANKEQLDERLEQLRDELLLADETVAAQERGDQGQAIVLTDSRLIIMKAGIAATGTLNGRKTGIYPFEQIKTVSLRKGPMGAVIQVTGEADGQGDERPENVVVFSGPDDVKRCDAFAAKIEAALGRPVERIEPHPEAAAGETEKAAPAKSRGGRVAKSLAEEMFEETVSEQSQPATIPVARKPEPIPAASAPESRQSIFERGLNLDSDRAPSQTTFGPNPHIPKPRRRSGSQPDRVLVLFGVLLAIVLLGVAIVAPMRRQLASPVAQLDVKQLTSNPALHRHQYIQVSGYRQRAVEILKESDASAASVRAAAGTGNRQALISAIEKDATGNAWNKLNDMNAPMGLAGAKESITSGLFIRKSAIEAAATGSVTPAATGRKLGEADERIAKGLAAMDQMLETLQAKIGGKAKAK